MHHRPDHHWSAHSVWRAPESTAILRLAQAIAEVLSAESVASRHSAPEASCRSRAVSEADLSSVTIDGSSKPFDWDRTVRKTSAVRTPATGDVHLSQLSACTPAFVRLPTGRATIRTRPPLASRSTALLYFVAQRPATDRLGRDVARRIFSILAPCRCRDTLLERVTTAAAVDLSVQIGALRLRNPIIAASGTFGYGVEFAHLVDLVLGGLVVKGLSREPMEGAPAPRLVETPPACSTPSASKTSVFAPSLRKNYPALRKYDTAVFANVFGYLLDDYVEVIQILEDADGLAGYDAVNISCPNVKRVACSSAATPPRSPRWLARPARPPRKRPLWVKLSPLVADIGLIARAAAEAGPMP